MVKINNNSRLGIALLFLVPMLLVLAIGCAKTMPDGNITMENQALEEEVATCQSASQDCLLSAGSINGIQACRTAFTTCLEEAAGQIDKVRTDLAACRDQSQKCLQEAKDAASVGRCRAALTECTAKANPAGGDVQIPTIDAGIITPPEVNIPGMECAQKAMECALSGKDPLTCADEARKCATALIPDSGFPTVPEIPGIGDLPTIPGLGDLPGADCMAKMRDCVQAGEKDLLTCASDARACMSESVPDDTIPTNPGIDIPTIPDGGITLPGSECRQALRDCLDAGTDPATCASDARKCVREAAAQP
jgi:hypothetical protein